MQVYRYATNYNYKSTTAEINRWLNNIVYNITYGYLKLLSTTYIVSPCESAALTLKGANEYKTNR